MDELLRLPLAPDYELEIRGPLGSIRLITPLTAPLVIICGGTGAAQAMSLLEALSRTPSGYRVGLLWGADDEADLYLREELQALDAPWLRCEFIADANRTENNRTMQRLRTLAPGFDALLKTGPDAAAPRSAPQILLAGSPGFVYAATDLLAHAGVAATRMRSDVYDYAPRS